MAQRRGRDFWAGVVSEFERSGVGQRAFAKTRGVNLGTFQHWLYRLRAEGRPRLLPVRVTPSGASSLVEVSAAGVVLRVPSDVDPHRVAALVSALETRAC